MFSFTSQCVSALALIRSSNAWALNARSCAAKRPQYFQGTHHAALDRITHLSKAVTTYSSDSISQTTRRPVSQRQICCNACIGMIQPEVLSNTILARQTHKHCRQQHRHCTTWTCSAICRTKPTPSCVALLCRVWCVCRHPLLLPAPSQCLLQCCHAAQGLGTQRIKPCQGCGPLHDSLAQPQVRHQQGSQARRRVEIHGPKARNFGN
jgi:hypothetical protein